MKAEQERQMWKTIWSAFWSTYYPLSRIMREKKFEQFKRDYMSQKFENKRSPATYINFPTHSPNYKSI